MSAILPLSDDVTGSIDDNACVRRSNSKSSNDIVIRVNTSFTASTCEKEVVDWIRDRLSDQRFNDTTDRGGSYLWNIVVGIRHNDWDGWNCLSRLDRSALLNQLVIAIHLTGGGSGLHYEQMDKQELITIDESRCPPHLEADDVLDGLAAEPQCVTGIGVSAVSSEYMAELWEEIIENDANTMDGLGKGYMVHPMWVRKAKWAGWVSIRERSCEFGWKNYHPRDDDDDEEDGDDDDGDGDDEDSDDEDSDDEDSDENSDENSDEDDDSDSDALHPAVHGARLRRQIQRGFCLACAGERVSGTQSSCANCPAGLKSERDIALEDVKENGNALRNFSTELRGDKDIVLEAVKQNGLLLHYASPELRGDKDVALEAVKQNGDALHDVSDELKCDVDFMLKAGRGGRAIFYVPAEPESDDEDDSLREQKFLALLGRGQDWRALEYASTELKGNRSVVLEAVKQHWFALEHASTELRGDKGIVLEAVKQDGWALQYASSELKGKQDGWALQHATTELQGDRGFVLKAVKRNWSALQYASLELQGDKDIVMKAARQNRHALGYASAELKGDRDFMLEAAAASAEADSDKSDSDEDSDNEDARAAVDRLLAGLRRDIPEDSDEDDRQQRRRQKFKNVGTIREHVLRQLHRDV